MRFIRSFVAKSDYSIVDGHESGLAFERRKRSAIENDEARRDETRSRTNDEPLLLRRSLATFLSKIKEI